MKQLTLLALLMLCTSFCYSQNSNKLAIPINGAKQAKQSINDAQDEALRKATEKIPKVETQLEQTFYKTRIDTASLLNKMDNTSRQIDNLIKSTDERRKHLKKTSREKLRAGWLPRRMGTKRDYNIDYEDPDYARLYTILSLMDDFGSKSKEGIHRWVQFMMREIIMEDEFCLCKDDNRSATQLVESGKNYSIIKIPANAKDIPPIMFVAHTDNGSNNIRQCYIDGLPIHYNYDGGSIDIGNDSILVTPIEKNSANQINQTLTDVEARTIITTNGKTPIGIDAVACSTLLVALCAQIAFNDTIRHGDVYFCITQNKKAIRKAKVLRSLYDKMGSSNDGLIVLLDGSNSQSYGITDNAPKKIKDIVEESYRTNGRIATQRALETTEKTEENYPPAISIYCGIKDPGTLGEWACLEYMKQSLQIAQSIVSMLGQK